MLRIYDTLSGNLREVSASDGKNLRFYCCGPTVYASAHIGNFRTFLVQDLFRRLVELNGLQTRHIRNITDVDDKTIAQSREQNQSLEELTQFWTKHFHQDCEVLGMLSPHYEPRATQHIEEQKILIASLIEKKCAYIAESGSVYFIRSSFPQYGQLVGQERFGNLEEEVQEGDERGEKRDFTDFVLWKAYQEKDGAVFWNSPWGKGRPGWHLECTSMALKYLGDGFDWHSGGVDLVFPHHENEIAQGESCIGSCFSQNWLHIEHLLVDGVKMSKSLNNLYTLSDIEKKGFTPFELRFALLNGHYRKQLNFSFQSLQTARLNLQFLSAFYEKVKKEADISIPSDYQKFLIWADGKSPQFFTSSFNAFCQDLNVPLGLGNFFKEAKVVSSQIDTGKLDKETANQIFFDLHFFAHLLGCDFSSSKVNLNSSIPEELASLASQRWEAKLAENWQLADSLREKIEKKGWKIVDKDGGYSLQEG